MKHIGTQQMETERLILRKFTKADTLDAYNNWFSDPDVALFMYWDAHTDKAQTEDFIKKCLTGYEKPNFYRWAITLKANNKVIGAIGFYINSEFDSVADVSYALSKKYWNQGIVSEALKQVIHYALMEVEINRLEAFHASANLGSGKAMQKAGMKYEGHARQKYKSHRGYEDCELYAILKEDLEKEKLAALYPIILREYNPAYPQWFEEEKAALMRLVGEKNIIRISHIGSTSVPGLFAKPMVDILLEITDNADIGRLMASLPPTEYICLNPPSMPTPPPHLMILKGYTSSGFAERVFHIHVRYQGDWDELYFRDYLIKHPETAAEYAQLKRELHKEFEYDRDGYTFAKGEFIHAVTEKAKRNGNRNGSNT